MCFLTTRRPRELLSANAVDVEVVHRLAPFLPIVHHQPEAVVEILLLFSDLTCDNHQVAKSLEVFDK